MLVGGKPTNKKCSYYKHVESKLPEEKYSFGYNIFYDLNAICTKMAYGLWNLVYRRCGGYATMKINSKRVIYKENK